jgi:hypothetical protein
MSDVLDAMPNGACVLYDEGLKKWAIFMVDGTVAGYRRSEVAALAFAESLPAMDLDPIIPLHRLSVSQEARARGVGAGQDVYQPVEEPKDGELAAAMSPARARSGAGPSERPVPAVAPRPRRET